MKTRLSSLVRFLSILFLAVWALAPRASAQSRPSLGLGFSAGQPTVTLTGAVGTVYSIQYATNLSPTNLWVDRTLLQAQEGGTSWTDPSVGDDDGILFGERSAIGTGELQGPIRI